MSRSQFPLFDAIPLPSAWQSWQLWTAVSVPCSHQLAFWGVGCAGGWLCRAPGAPPWCTSATGSQRHEESTGDQSGLGGFVHEDHDSRRQIYQVVPAMMRVWWQKAQRLFLGKSTPSEKQANKNPFVCPVRGKSWARRKVNYLMFAVMVPDSFSMSLCLDKYIPLSIDLFSY